MVFQHRDKYSVSDRTSNKSSRLDAYCVFYLELKSHDPASKEEDIVQTFLRLQEGTPLNKAEKINAYLLVSYLRKRKADNSNLHNEIAEFAKEFLKNVHSFSMYDLKPPKGMTKDVFDKYKTYKQESKILTTADSLQNRLEILVSEFKRMHPIILKDPKRLHDIEEKRVLYFRQKGLCAECSKEMRFDATSAHHGIAHSEGGKTGDLSHAVLLHEKCHARIEKRKRKEKELGYKIFSPSL